MKKLCYKCLHYGEPTTKSEKPKYSTIYAPVSVDNVGCAKFMFRWFFLDGGIQNKILEDSL